MKKNKQSEACTDVTTARHGYYSDNISTYYVPNECTHPMENFSLREDGIMRCNTCEPADTKNT